MHKSLRSSGRAIAVLASALSGAGCSSAGEAEAPVDSGPVSQSSDASAVGIGGSNAGAAVVTDSDAGSGCHREVTLTALSLQAAPPFDVIIIADHSQSLAWSRDQLAAGLSTLLAGARGRDARFFLLTPTQYGETSAAAINRFDGLDLVQWRDPAAGQAFSSAATEYTQTCTNAAGNAIVCPAYDRNMTAEYKLEGRWDFVMPAPIAAISADMNDAQIAAQQQAIRAAITNVQGSGSPSEQPLCTLNRYLLQNPGTLPQHALFVVISDEDDVSTPEQCLASYHYERTSVASELGAPCMSSSCDVYQYIMTQTALRQPLRYRCALVDDLGNLEPVGAVWSSTWLNGSLASDCTTASATGPCGEGALRFAKSSCPQGMVLQDCSASCEEVQTEGCLLQLPGPAAELCGQAFSYKDKAYADLADYCDRTLGARAWTGCERHGFNAGSRVRGVQISRPLVPGEGVDALISGFLVAASKVFKRGSHFVEVIGLQPSFACQPAQGQSYATNLSKIASSSQDVFPICGSYSDALARLHESSRSWLDSALALSLAADERVQSVEVRQRDGARRPLGAGVYRYDRARQLLSLDASTIGGNDVALAVQIEKICGVVLE